MQKKLPPIPIPPAQKWREFNIRIVPVILFLACLAGVATLWKTYVLPTSLVGQVEPVYAEVTSPQPGLLADLKVARFQEVKKGDAVAEIFSEDMQMPLSLVEAEMDLLRIRMEKTLTGARNSMDFEQLRTTWMEQKVLLASTRANLNYARQEFNRTKKLYEDELVSASEYDLAMTKKDDLEAELTQRLELIEKLKTSLAQLGASVTNGTDFADSEFQSNLQAFQQRVDLLQARTGPIVLKAPINGVVSMVYCRAGQTVMDGQPILTISAKDSERIVGYLRQPLNWEPKQDMNIKVRTRSAPRQEGIGKLLKVGARFEPITNALARVQWPVESGLPILVSVPKGMNTRPGELVDLIVQMD
ncbi:MAG: HlyD family efflux transporter periplasmic adaptor subunit [Verrucomicrobia bacterium]|nr:HlyD family efflux transporter periplasmic adaptor subunit [Verrucomicrobiota bacterium]